ncbi:MAG: hypothetical protein LAN37_10000 [Acidobacteriia bacterium]|nr:hypothetical protein [Terriglobia bacterium]
MPAPEKTGSQSPTAVVVPLAVALIGTLGLIVSAIVQRPHPQPPRPSGSITAPLPGQRVSAIVGVEGKLSGIPGQHHVWLAVQVGNSLWPKEPEVPHRHQHWRREIVEAGLPREGKFSLVLIMVGPKGQADIEQWVQRGHRTNDWPGLTQVTDGEQLAVVGDLQVESR